MPPYIQPTVTDFKNWFIRDFPYGTDPTVAILDQDIFNAITKASYAINSAFFGDQGSFNIQFLNISAHYLVMSIRSSSQGVVGQYNFLQNSKGVGSVSESFQIPEEIAKDSLLSMLCKTNYGAEYVQYLIPYIRGAMYTVCGETKP